MDLAEAKAKCLSKYIQGKIILDLGASEGKLHLMLEKYTKKKITGVNLIGEPDIKTDLNKKFPFRSNYADTIIASEIIEHIKNPFFFWCECKRVLKPSGLLVITTPNAMGLSEWQGFFTKEKHLDYTGHIYSWHYRTMYRIIKESKFEILHFDFISFFWKRNYIFRLLVEIFPPLKPNLLFVLQKRVDN